MSDVDACREFLQRTLRIQSPPGGEEEMARSVVDEMHSLGYDEASVDEAGNALGRIRGRGDAPAVWFVTHLDHVDAGDPDRWPHPPFGGEIHDGRVWGRGAVDIKGPLAAQVHGLAPLASSEDPPPGEVVVAALVQEEVGGLGARHLAAGDPPELAVVGEPSGNGLRRGHRGRAELVVHAVGESCHASEPDRGANALSAVGLFLAGLDDAVLPSHPELGPATVAPTLIRTDQESANVIPGEAWLTCDCRLVPGQTAESLRDALIRVLERRREPGVDVTIEIPVEEVRSWTGMEMEMPADNPAYLLDADDPAVTAASRILEEAGLESGSDVWRFATDGGHLAAAGTTCVGFGPGDETLAHTVRESIPVEALERGMAGNLALARGWPQAVVGTPAP